MIYLLPTPESATDDECLLAVNSFSLCLISVPSRVRTATHQTPVQRPRLAMRPTWTVSGASRGVVPPQRGECDASEPSQRVHADRAARRHRDHRDPDWPAAAGCAEGPRGRGPG